MDIIDVNNEDVWSWQWVENATGKTVETINCKDLIESWTDLSSDERAALIAETQDDYMLCPKMDTFKV